MKKILLTMCAVLILFSLGFNYIQYPAIHQVRKDQLTTDGLAVTRIVQILADPNADMAWGIRYFKFDDFTGNKTEKITPFSMSEMTSQTVRIEQRTQANKYLLDTNQTEFDEARIIFKTKAFKASLDTVVDTISTSVIDANCTAQINVLRDAGYADIDVLKEGATGNYLIALNSLRGYIGTYTAQLKLEITESNLISKIDQYKSAMTDKVTAAIAYDPPHTAEYNGFKASHDADIATLDSWCDDKIILMALVTTLKTDLSTSIDFEDESLGSDLTDAINTMEAEITSNIDDFTNVDYSDIKTELLALISAYEDSL